MIMHHYYLVYEATLPGDPPRPVKNSAVIQAPPLSPQVIGSLYQQLGAAIAKQAGATDPVPLVITNIIQLPSESGIIIPGGGR